MPQVQSIGATDYAMPVEQNQYASEPTVEENVPTVYEPEIEEKKRSAAAQIGLTALGLIAAGGLGYYIGHSGNKANNAMKDTLKEINKDAKEFSEKNVLARAYYSKSFAESIKEKTKAFVKDAKDAAGNAA